MIQIEIMNSDYLYFRITRQDRISDRFNFRLGKFCDVFVASNGFVMASGCWPEVASTEILTNNVNLYVRGEDDQRDLEVLTAPSKEWFDAMLVAIGEYNDMFTEEDPGPLRLPAKDD